MSMWKCPVCGGELNREANSYRCGKGHSFDIAKQGYVNLLMSNKASTKRHGDDKLMVVARREFLDKGYYLPLRELLCRLAKEHCPEGAVMADIGCGECWYSEAVRQAVDCGSAWGIDISREALKEAAKRTKKVNLAVGSVNAIPLEDESCDLLLNIFAPHDDGEFLRVLKPGGIYLRAVPLEKHLFGLKSAVYDEPYENDVPDYRPEGFEYLGREDVRYDIELGSNTDIKNLFMMTPYYYKTSARDQQKLDSLENLATRCEFGVHILKKPCLFSPHEIK